MSGSGHNHVGMSLCDLLGDSFCTGCSPDGRHVGPVYWRSGILERVEGQESRPFCQLAEALSMVRQRHAVVVETIP